MIYGFPYSVPYGSHQHFAQQLSVVPIAGGIKLLFNPLYSGVYRLWVDGIPFPPQNCTAGEITEFHGPFSLSGIDHQWSLCPQGDWTADDIDVSPQPIEWQADRSTRIHMDVDTIPRLFSYDDAGQLTNWTLSGIKRFYNCRPVSLRPTWGSIDVTIVDVTGNRTVTLLLDDVPLAAGSITGDGTITLVGIDDSGIAGTVDIAYTADVDATLIAEFPAKIKIHYRANIPFVGGDFPRTPQDTVNDDHRQAVVAYRSSELAAGLYYALAHQTDDSGNESAGVGGDAVDIVDIPENPGTPVYTSGDYSDTLISFVASATVGCTYNIYDSMDTEFLDIESIVATHIAGVGTLTQTLPAIDSGFTGIRYVLIRSTYGGIESGNYDILEIEYLSGVVIRPRPPAPILQTRVATVGLTLTVYVSINTTEQKCAANILRLYVVPAGTLPVWGSPTAIKTLGSAIGNSIVTSISATMGSSGPYEFAIRTFNTANSSDDGNTTLYGPVDLSNIAPVDPITETRAGT